MPGIEAAAVDIHSLGLPLLRDSRSNDVADGFIRRSEELESRMDLEVLGQQLLPGFQLAQINVDEGRDDVGGTEVLHRPLDGVQSPPWDSEDRRTR